MWDGAYRARKERCDTHKGEHVKIKWAIIFCLSSLLPVVVPALAAGTADTNGPAVLQQAKELQAEADSAVDYERVEKHLKKALTIFRRKGDTDGLRKALLELGRLEENRGMLAEAARYYQKAAQAAKRMKSPRYEAEALDRLGSARFVMGQYRKAQESFKQALSLTEKLQDREAHAETLLNLANIDRDRGDYQTAVTQYNQALSISREIDKPGLEVEALNGLGTVALSVGEHDRAVTFLEEALEVSETHDSAGPIEHVLINLGYVHRNIGRYSAAAEYFRRALEHIEKTGNRESEALLLSNLGELFSDWGRQKRALEYYNEALEIYTEVNDKTGEARNLVRIARALEREGDYRAAFEKVSQALEILRYVGGYTAEAEELAAGLCLDLGEPGKARAFAKQVHSDALDGRLYLAEGDYGKARLAYQKVLRDARQTRRADDLFTAYTGLAVSYEKSDRLRAAEKQYDMAVQLVEDLRSGLLPSARRSFLSVRVNGFSRAAPAKGLTRVLMKQGKWGESLVPSEMARARAFADKLSDVARRGYTGVPDDVLEKERDLVRTAAAIKKLRDCCSRKSDPKRWDTLDAELEKARKKLDEFVDMLWREYTPYAAVKYPRPVKPEDLDLGDGYIAVFDDLDEGIGIKLLKGKEVIHGQYLEWTSEELAKAVREFRRPFETVRLSDFDPSPAKELYRKLLSELTAKLPEGAPLAIVPSGVLAVLPFEALVTGGRVTWESVAWGKSPQGLTYFGDVHPLSYFQSLTALALLRRKASEATAKDTRILVVADPVFKPGDSRARQTSDKSEEDRLRELGIDIAKTVETETEGSLDFQRLEETGELADTLVKMFEGSGEAYTGLKADKQMLFDTVAPKLKDYSYIVFATHGVYTTEIPGIMEPVLAMTMVPRPKDSFLTMNEVMSLDLNAEVAALTACQTGLGEHVSGEGVMSMGRAFQFAGARSVLMSLWSVEQTASCMLVERFFRHLKEGKSRREALTLARKDIRENGYDHPFFWAAFVLVGLAD
jgi:CHAT domain-containing protein/tetratricopeptide (TPR) repeat protein